MNTEYPIVIRKMLDKGHITPEQAQQMHAEPRPMPLTVMAGPAEDVDFQYRQMWEAGVRHRVGLVTYGLIGIVDGVTDGLAYGFAEVTENATFLVSRTIRRAKEGWQRGKN